MTRPSPHHPATSPSPSPSPAACCPSCRPSPARAAARATERTAERGSFVVWDSTVVYAGLGKIRAHGKVPGGKRKVAMQVKVKRSWQTLATTRSNGKGKFRITSRLDWYGGHKVRVIAPGRRPFVRAKKVTSRRSTSRSGARGTTTSSTAAR